MALLRLLSMILVPAAWLAARELPVRSFTTADGLVHNRVQRIVRDSRGLLWMCTGGGISRFDGAQFQSFGVAQGLPYPSVNDLLETPEGDFWLATNGGGVIRFSLSAAAPRYQSFAVSGGPSSNRVNLLFRGPDGTIWAGTDGGLFRMKIDADRKATFTRVDLRLPGHPDATAQVFSIVADPDGSVWVDTRFGVVRILTGGCMIWYPIRQGPETDLVMALLESPGDGLLWIGHQAGLAVFKPPPSFWYAPDQGLDRPFEDFSLMHSVAGKPRSILEAGAALPQKAGEGVYFDVSPLGGSPVVAGLERSQSGAIRVVVGAGILEYSAGRFTLLDDSRLRAASLETIAEDREGNLWVGTRAGVLRVARRGFVTFRDADGPTQMVSSIFEDRAGDVIAISEDWRVSRYDGHGFLTVRANVPLSVRALSTRGNQDVLADRAGDWWWASRSGVLRFSGIRRIEDLTTATPRLYTSRDGLAQDSMLHLFEDSRGDIWMSALIPGREVLTRWDRASGRFQRYSDADGLRAFNSPSAFSEDSHGVLWIGFRDGGMARYAEGRFTMRSEADSLPPGGISATMIDRAGRLWFAGGSMGLYQIGDLSAVPLRPVLVLSPPDLPGGERVQRIIEDRAGNVYAANDGGVFRIEPGSNRIADLYTTSDGLAGTEVLSAFADRHGKLWFGTGQGLSYFVPNAQERASAPGARIGGLHIAGVERAVSPAGEQSVAALELFPGRSQLQIDFFGISFATGDALRYEYRLLGADDNWSDPSPLRSVLFSNLAPGGYEFEVRALSARGTRSPQPARVVFAFCLPSGAAGGF